MTAPGRVPSDEPFDAAADQCIAPLLRPNLPPGFSRRITVLLPGERCSLSAREWRASLIVLTRGLVAITTAGGDHTTFSEGSIVSFDGLPTADATNVGDTDAILVSLSRITASGQADDFCPPDASQGPERPSSDHSIAQEGPTTAG